MAEMTRRLWVVTAAPTCGAVLAGAVPALAAEAGDAAALSTRLLPLGEGTAIPWALHPSWFLVIAVFLPAAIWFALAWQRALAADVNARRRHGLRDLRRLLRRAGSPGPVLLRRWLAATARTWNVPGAAPSARDFQTGLGSDDAGRAIWIQLWNEAEHALYSSAGTIPPDWLERASRAAAGLTAPSRTTFWPDQRRYWLPRLTAAASIVLVTQLSTGAANVAADVPPGTPGGSLEEAVTLALRNDWTDWAAHHDRAILHMRDRDWGRAVAHAVNAFVLNPGSTDVRDALRFALEQEGSGADPGLRMLLDGGPHQRLPTLLAPAYWQRLTLFAILALGVGLSVLVTAQYLPGRRLLPAGVAISALSASVAMAGLYGFAAYGTLADLDAAVVQSVGEARSIPTDLSPAEQTAPLHPGTVLQTQRRFLGWYQVVSSGQPGAWVRRATLLELYRQGPEVDIPPAAAVVALGR